MGFNPISLFNGPFNGQQKHGLLNGVKDRLKSVTCKQTLNKALSNPPIPPPTERQPYMLSFPKMLGIKEILVRGEKEFYVDPPLLAQVWNAQKLQL